MNKAIKIGKVHTSRRELIDIAKAWLVLSVAFAFAITNITILSGRIGAIFSVNFLLVVLASMFTAGIGFLLHELAHKFVAQKFGCAAEFRAYDQMLYLGFALVAFLGVLIFAPGAVMISGMITRRENGLISAAGPLTNYVLGMFFLGLGYVVPTLGMVWQIGFRVNIWLGLFNMIPFLMFDGKKIFNWSPWIWGAMSAFGVVFGFFV